MTLERLQIEVCLGQQLLEAGVLDFQVLEAAGLISLHATVLGAPLVERWLAEPALAADIPDWQA